MKRRDTVWEEGGISANNLICNSSLRRQPSFAWYWPHKFRISLSFFWHGIWVLIYGRFQYGRMIQVIADTKINSRTNQGLNSLSFETFCCPISRSLEAARRRFTVIPLFCNLKSVSVAVLPRCLPNSGCHYVNTQSRGFETSWELMIRISFVNRRVDTAESCNNTVITRSIVSKNLTKATPYLSR